MAYKFAAEQAVTLLKSIDIQVGKTGALTPVANLEPVQLSGTTVSRASLHNADFIAEKDIRVGDMVVVEKAGEIIPYISRAEHGRRTGTEMPFVFPTACPVCGSVVARMALYGVARGANALPCSSAVYVPLVRVRPWMSKALAKKWWNSWWIPVW
ncbi:MAG: hypothetical protein EBS30_17450 [Planctomycetes bacterium]|nr:hypothetical protein [Planctomycetota bacterium]